MLAATKELLLEIGTEELPAAYVPLALQQLKDLAQRLFAEQRLAVEGIKTLGTPRRLALLIERVPVTQAELVQESKGPAKRVAFTPDGAPTQAALGFARSQGVAVEDLEVRETPQGEYVFAVRRLQGQGTAALLPELLPRLITSLNFPKTMRWGSQDLRFARPLRWLVALFDDEVVTFSLAGVESGRMSRGHRFLSGGPVLLESPERYEEKLRQAYVLVDPAARREEIRRQAAEVAATQGGEVLFSENLLTEVTNLVEYPTAILGSFDSAYLDLPREVLLTPMREHQRYFPVVAQGEGPAEERPLLPYFVAIRNGTAEAAATVREGYEKVLRARLADARFFYDQDRKTPLAARVESLRGIVYQEELGTVYDKKERMVGFVRELAGELGLAETVAAPAVRAAELAKADLVTQMVGEFPELQGIMGREYALASGEPEAVATAIFEHYLPRFAGDVLPQTLPGRLVALADKFDTLCGCFGVGLRPTGSEDPYALRRQALGVIAIILDGAVTFPLTRLLELALAQYGDKFARPLPEIAGEVREFILGRLRGVAAEEGLRPEVLGAVLATGEDSLPRVMARARSLAVFAARPEFADLLTGYTRAANLVGKAEGKVAGAADPALFQEEAEKELAAALAAQKPRVEAALKAEDWETALAGLAELRTPIDRFFTAVLVMAEDPALRANRLALLGAAVALFREVAEFGMLS